MPLIGTLASDHSEWVEGKRKFDKHYLPPIIHGELNMYEAMHREKCIAIMGAETFYQGELGVFTASLNMETITAPRWFMTASLAKGVLSESRLYVLSASDRINAEKYLPWEDSAAPCLTL